MDINKLHKEVLEDLNPDKAREVKAAMGQLIESYGYKVLAQYLEVYYKSNMVAIAQKPLASMDETLAQEYSKGEIAAVILLLQFPQNLYDYCQEVIENASEQEDLSDGWTTEAI